MTDYISTYLQETNEIAALIDRQAIASAIDLLYDLRQRRGRLFILGNGGSAANASHAVSDFRKSVGFEAYAPSDNVAEMSAWANDVGWDVAYERWLDESYLNENDALLVLSVGGGSPDTSRNLCLAMRSAVARRASILSIVGRDGGMAKELSTVCILVPTVNEERITPHVEGWQAVLLHLIFNELRYRQWQ
jgi:D-sedoheptulose 7-phosphate isomerase